MPQQNSERVSHTNEALPSTFRDDTVFQALNDLVEDSQNKGHVEVIRSGAFVSQIIIWETVSKINKRKQIDISRSVDPPFIATVTTTYYNDDGSIAATVTDSPSRSGDKQIINANTDIVRP